MNKLYTPYQPTLSKAGLSSLKLTYEYASACKILTGLVHSYLQIISEEPTPYPIIPDGTQAIYISVDGSIVGGSQSQATNIQLLKAGSYFGIWFYPSALRHFFNLDLSEITNQFVDYQYLKSKKNTQLHQQIYQHNDFQKRKEICEKWLLESFKPQQLTKFDWALSLIYQSFGNIKVNQLSEIVGWSSRHLNRMFLQHTGLSTKTFTNIIRMQHACKKLSLTLANSAHVALELGYFDQSHLIKDFNKFLLTNPSDFFNRYKSDFYNR